MTVPELCDTLIAALEGDIAAVQQGGNAPVLVADDALSLGFLQDTLDQLFRTITKTDSREDELIGTLEANAFLGAFQGAYEAVRKPRMERWADIYSDQQRQVSDKGALKTQLRSIGVKVDDEFVRDTIAGQP